MYALLTCGAYFEQVKKGSISRKLPRTYSEAKLRMLNDLNLLLEKIATNSEYFLSEIIICLRMEPDFTDKIYKPTTLTTEQLKIVSEGDYHLSDQRGKEQQIKIYFARTTESGIRELQAVLESGTRDADKLWQNQLRSLQTINLLTPAEKLKGITEDWKAGNLRLSFHPLGKEVDKVLQQFYHVSKIPPKHTLVRKTSNGALYISTKCRREDLEKILLLNSLRSVESWSDLLMDPIVPLHILDAVNLIQ